MSIFTSWLSGLVFGFGLIVSGMANPAKVLGFLDLAGRWDPSLAVVMAGAIAVGSIGFFFARGRTRSLTGSVMALPAAGRVDRRLMAGSVLFGVGWGLAGFCPGPALVGLAGPAGLAGLGSGEVKALVFVAAMLAGMGLFAWLEKRRSQPPASNANTNQFR